MTGVVSIVVPVLNEREGLPRLLDCLTDLRGELASEGFEMQVVITDNASTDGSWEFLKEQAHRFARLEAYQFTRNYGFQESLLFGLSRASGDCAVLLQSDLQDPPELIPGFLALWREGNLAVAGRASSRSEGRVMQVIRRAFYSMVDSASDAPLSRGVTDFYLLDRRVIDDVVASKPPMQLLRIYVAEHFGFGAVVDYARRPRISGTPSLRLGDYYRIALDGLLLSGGRAIRRLTIFSFALAGLALVIAAVLVAAFVLGWRPAVAGWMSLSVGFSLLVSIVGASSGLTLEYLVRLSRLAQPGPRPVVWQSLAGANDSSR